MKLPLVSYNGVLVIVTVEGINVTPCSLIKLPLVSYNGVLVIVTVEGINVTPCSLIKLFPTFRIFVFPKSVGYVTPQKTAFFLVITVRT